MKSKLTFIIALIFMVGLFNHGEAIDSKDVAFLFKTNGKVEIQKTNTKTWNRGKRGYRLHSGDKIKTGDNSIAALYFTDDKSMMKIRSRSDVTIQGERKQKSISKRIFMQAGEVFVSVKKQNTLFRLETPTGVAAVKGTDFYALFSGGIFKIFAISGIVELINQYGSVLVQAGNTGTSDGNNPPDVKPTNPDDQPDWGGDNQPQGQEDEMKIEFKDKDSNIKTMKLQNKAKGN